MKLSGITSPWKTHLDINRLGTYQNLIALTDTVVAIWPKSHKMDWDTPLKKKKKKGAFYELQKRDMNRLARKGILLKELKLYAGDVFIMEGGRLPHTVPGVPAKANHRYMTYAHYKPKRDSH